MSNVFSKGNLMSAFKIAVGTVIGGFIGYGLSQYGMSGEDPMLLRVSEDLVGFAKGTTTIAFTGIGAVSGGIFASMSKTNNIQPS